MMRPKTHFEIFFETGEVETNSLLVEVAVVLDLKSRVTKDGGVVTP